jgi:hypothetical protein
MKMIFPTVKALYVGVVVVNSKVVGSGTDIAKSLFS